MRLFIITLLFLTVYAQASEPTLARLNWLSGYWQNDKDTGTTEECWVHSGPDDMLGMHRSRNINGAEFLEYLKIESTPQGIVYIAYPAGQEKTVFKLSAMSKNKVIFSNPNHDFPQNITYWLDELHILHASANGSVNGNYVSHEWILNKTISH